MARGAHATSPVSPTRTRGPILVAICAAKRSGPGVAGLSQVGTAASYACHTRAASSQVRECRCRIMTVRCTGESRLLEHVGEKQDFECELTSQGLRHEDFELRVQRPCSAPRRLSARARLAMSACFPLPPR